MIVRLATLEFLKWKRSKVLVSAVVATVIGPFVAALSTIQKLASATPDVTWGSYFGVALQVDLSLIYPIIFGALAAYVFVQEYEDRTIINLFTLPVTRAQVAWVKMITIYVTLLALVIVSTILTFVGGSVLVPAPLTMATVLQFTKLSLTTSIMALMFVPVFIYIGIRTRHFIPPLVAATGFTFLNFASLVSETYGPFIPTAIPVFYLLKDIGWGENVNIPFIWSALIPILIISTYITLREYQNSDIH